MSDNAPSRVPEGYKPSPSKRDRERMERERRRAQKQRDKSTNNSRTRSEGTHRPSLGRTRRDIMNEIT